MTSNHTSSIVQPQALVEAGVIIRDETAKEGDAIGLLTQAAFMRDVFEPYRAVHRRGISAVQVS
ncbi:hypothetical protein [Novilysobacter erysipheiresistens]|uniref:Uncharacterized protein n=1 Tax=Novilysobacter erysipheiresistens TaxID=1749332 RepID=A0ABU7YVH7_9GAMM